VQYVFSRKGDTLDREPIWVVKRRAKARESDPPNAVRLPATPDIRMDFGESNRHSTYADRVRIFAG
jgi:hypothetical protein